MRRAPLTGKFEGEAAFFVTPSEISLGHIYKKTIFREYTDATFTTLKPRPAAWQHLGLLGPLVRAEVGDTIEITFRNNAKHPHSMHPHGVFYRKDSEGTLFSRILRFSIAHCPTRPSPRSICLPCARWPREAKLAARLRLVLPSSFFTT